MRVLLFLFFVSLCIISCDKEDTPPVSNGCESVIISNDQFNIDHIALGNAIDASIQDDCLTVTVGVGGCDSNHKITMITDGSIAESLPPQITFLLRDNDPQLCNAYFTLEREFDLTAIRELADYDIQLNFVNSDVTILYEK